MLTPTEVIEELSDLMQWDIDAIAAYQQAIDNINEVSISDTLTLFKEDHQRHIDHLREAIQNAGGTPPKQTADFKGFVIQGFTAIRSLTGTPGALKAMIANEKLLNQHYESALKKDFTDDIATILEKNYADEQHHLQTLSHILESLDS